MHEFDKFLYKNNGSKGFTPQTMKLTINGAPVVVKDKLNGNEHCLIAVQHLLNVTKC